MAQVPVDIRVDIDGLGAFRKLEKSFQRLNKMAQDLRVQLKSRRAERQLRGLTRGVDQLEKKASDIDVKFDVDDRALKRAERRVDALGKNVRAGVDVAGGEGSGGGNSASGIGASLLGIKAFEQTAEYQKEIEANFKDLIKTSGDYQKAAEDVAEAQSKVADKTERADEIIREMQSQGLEGLEKQAKKTGRSVKQLQNDQKNAFSRAQGDLKRYEEQLGEAEKAERRLRKAVRDRAEEQVKAARKASRGKRFAGAAAAGVGFSNLPGGGFGAAALGGAAFGGGKGALIAVAAKAITDLGVAAANYATEATKAAAETAKLELALGGIAGLQTNQALKAVRGTVDDFNTPLQEATRNFTQLYAATEAAGFGVATTERVFRGLASANKALGGDAQKLQGIMLATTQVFSKGKVSAEELRGQIGERLPGAFSKFAQATGRSTQELDKALELGEVGLEDFVKFAEKLLNDYEEDAKKIASGPEEAGARLQTALRDLQRNVGSLLTPIGAAFQNEFTAIINIIDRATQALANFLGLGTQGAIKKTQRELSAAFERYNKLIAIERRNKQNGLPFDPTYVNSAVADIEKLTQKLRDLRAYSQPQGPDNPDPLTPKEPKSSKGKEVVDNLKERLRLSEQAADIAVQELEAATAVGDIEKLRADAAVDILELGYARINALEAETDAQVRRNINDEYDAKLLNRNLQLTNDIADARAKAAEGLFQPKEATALEEYISKTQTELNDTDARIASIAETIETELSTAMADAFVGFIDGTKSAQEAAADMFKNIGRAFIEMATQMIAKAIILKALGVPLSGGGSATTFDVPGVGTAKGFFPLGEGFSYKGGGYTGSGPRAGGVDGQGGFPAILHPDETVIDHREPMGRYNAGGGGAGGSHRTISFQSEVINNVEYVTAEQAMAMSRAAADDGARRGAAGGESRVMSSLRNRRSARSRLGLR